MIETGIKILITGDFCPIGRVEELALSGKFEVVYNDFKDVLTGNDLIITDWSAHLPFPLRKEKNWTSPESSSRLY